MGSCAQGSGARQDRRGGAGDMALAAHALVDDRGAERRRDGAVRREAVDARDRVRRARVELPQAHGVQCREQPGLVAAVRAQRGVAGAAGHDALRMVEVRRDPAREVRDLGRAAGLGVAHAARDGLRLARDRHGHGADRERAVALALAGLVAAGDERDALGCVAAIGKVAVGRQCAPVRAVELDGARVAAALDEQRALPVAHARAAVVGALPLGDGVGRDHRVEIVPLEHLAERVEALRGAPVQEDGGRAPGGHAGRLPA